MYRFSRSIDNNWWIKSIDFRFRFLSINYAWFKYQSVLIAKFLILPNQILRSYPLPLKKWILMISGPHHFMVVTGRETGCYPVLLSSTGLGEKKVPSGSLGQVDFLAGQVTLFSAYLPNGQSSRRVTGV